MKSKGVNMRAIFLLILFIPIALHAGDAKISQLPLGSAATTGINDSFPYVNFVTDTTERLTLWDLVNLPPIQTALLTVQPMTTFGDMVYENSAPVPTRLPGNISTTKMYLSQVGNSVTSGTPLWSQPNFSELAGTASLTTQVTGLLPVANGGLGVASPAVHSVLLGEGTSATSNTGAGAAGSLLGGLGASSDPAFTSTPTLGINGTSGTTGQLNFANGVTSGASISVKNGGATTAYNFNLPTTAGTSGFAMLSGGGGASAMTWASVLTNPMTTGGDLIYGGSSGTATRLANGTSGQVLQSAGGTAAPAWSTLPGNTTALKIRTIQRFISSSGTYTLPSGPAPLYIVVKMIGGGGGGGSAGTASTTGGAGGNSTFGASLTAGGGGGGAQTVTVGAGGTNTISTGTIVVNAIGGTGNTGNTSLSNFSTGGAGGSSFYGGSAQGGQNTPGFSAATNTGGGGGGGGGAGTPVVAGGGGGAGGYIEVLIASPSSTYAYAVGAGGAAGTGSVNSGGGGGSGVIAVEEYYQ